MINGNPSTETIENKNKNDRIRRLTKEEFENMVSNSKPFRKVTLNAKKNSYILETKVLSDTIYHFPKWEIDDGWIIHDLKYDRYFVPEDYILFEKNTIFEWDAFKNKSKEFDIYF